MDRGTDAADTVVTYLFLYLLPVRSFGGVLSCVHMAWTTKWRVSDE